ncbi:MAG: MarR family transcriptional regulator [Spirochaetes bacterium]|nr:MarR family transcriptional regulator [Spirochaetota bacterium]
MANNEDLLRRYAEGQRFLFMGEQCLNLTKKALDPIIRGYGLNHSQYVILMILNYAELTGEKVISTELAYILGREKHTITPLVESLVKAGYIQRNGDPGDRRLIVLTLTGTGRDLIREVQPLTFATLADIPFGDEDMKKAFFAFLETFRRIFAQKSGQDPELYSGTYNRLLVNGEAKLLHGFPGVVPEAR